ncbi:MAG: bifunctional chorismate mutase/prephenate dehydratase [Oscillospiraceae bacterium]|nr:bifunctional chorismate mutase/prephenate dehydratase [Oscillospiraceae bacterium]
MDLTDYRRQIDEVDARLVDLFAERMRISAEIGAYKKAHGLPVLNAGREAEKLTAVSAAAPEELSGYTRELYSLLMELSRAYQSRLTGSGSELTDRVEAAAAAASRPFPSRVTAACQGVEGAYSQLACEKMIREADIRYYPTFDSVFEAIENGECRYGVLPVENSTAGSVNKVYDAMQRHRFSIVRSVRLKVDHNLLTLPGAGLSDVRRIYSHEQAISQCSEFLKTLPDAEVIPCANTAVAARMVAEAGRKDMAALSSRACMELYGLSCAAENVQNQDSNYTRFACISRELEIYPGADRTSLMLILSHEPGSLYKVLSRLYALDINLIKLESRPLPDRDFEFMFYFDLDVPVRSPALLQLLRELGGLCESFTYLGSYSEVV